MKLVRHTFRVVGVSPVMMHSIQGMIDADEEKKGGNVQHKKPVYDKLEEAEKGAYRLPSGELYLPAVGFRNAMLEACKGRKINKKAAKMVVAAAVFNTENEKPVLLDAKGKPTKEYEIDTRTVVVRVMGKVNRIIRHRPLIRDWRLDLELDVDEDFVDVAVVRELLNLGGTFPGVFDFRPGCGGPFGRFKVE